MSEAHLVRRFVGGLLMAVGGLIVGLCGLCTGISELVLLYRVWSTWGDGHGIDTSILAAMIFPLVSSVIPILIGLGLFFWGRHLLRQELPK